LTKKALEKEISRIQDDERALFGVLLQASYISLLITLDERFETAPAPKNLKPNVLMLRFDEKGTFKPNEKDFEIFVHFDPDKPEQNSPWNKFDLCYPHLMIPLKDAHPPKYGCSIEGIWQGIKTFDDETHDLSKFGISNGHGIRRPGKNARYVDFTTHELNEMDIEEAKDKVLIPAFNHIIAHNCKSEYDELLQKMNDGYRIVIYANKNRNDNFDWDTHNGEITGGMLLALFLSKKFPLRSRAPRIKKEEGTEIKQEPQDDDKETEQPAKKQKIEPTAKKEPKAKKEPIVKIEKN